MQRLEQATGSFKIKDHYLIYDTHYSVENKQMDDDLGFLNQFGSDFDIESEKNPKLTTEIKKDVKQNEIIGYGKSKSIIVKAI